MDGEDSSPTGRPLSSRGPLVLAAPIWGSLEGATGACWGRCWGLWGAAFGGNFVGSAPERRLDLKKNN